MADNTKIPALNTTNKEERVLNEYDAKIENEEKLDTVVEARQDGETTLHDTMPFDCECDDKDCEESILMSTEEYKQVHLKSNKFVVIPSHVHLDIEEIVTSFSNYVTEIGR